MAESISVMNFQGQIFVVYFLGKIGLNAMNKKITNTSV